MEKVRKIVRSSQEFHLLEITSGKAGGNKKV